MHAYGTAAVDNGRRVGSPAAIADVRQRRTVRDAIRSARSAELTPPTWLVVGSVLTDLRRILAELEGSRHSVVNVPVRRTRRAFPSTPALRRSFRPKRTVSRR